MASTAPPPRTMNRGRGLFGGLLAMVILVVIALAVVWAYETWIEDDDDLGAAGDFTTIESIVAEPSEYYGEDVIISGEVNRVIGPWAYTVGGEEFTGGEEILVVGPPPAVIADRAPDQTVYENDIVQVAGTVREFDPATIEDELDGELPAADQLTEFNGQPAIVGETMGLSPRLSTIGDLTEIEEILEEPGEWYDERATVSGDISTVISGNAFVLDGQLLVIDSTGLVARAALAETESVRVAGPVHEFSVADIEEQTGLDLDDEAFAEYENSPMILAEGIQLLTIAE